jgi:hypothetical protein
VVCQLSACNAAMASQSEGFAGRTIIAGNETEGWFETVCVRQADAARSVETIYEGPNSMRRTRGTRLLLSAPMIVDRRHGQSGRAFGNAVP